MTPRRWRNKVSAPTFVPVIKNFERFECIRWRMVTSFLETSRRKEANYRTADRSNPDLSGKLVPRPHVSFSLVYFHLSCYETRNFPGCGRHLHRVGVDVVCLLFLGCRQDKAGGIMKADIDDESSFPLPIGH